MSRLLAAAVTFCALSASAAALGQVLPTSVTASFPDPNGKVPGFNLVPGAGITNWSNSLALAVLTHGNSYNYCVSLGSGNSTGKATVSFKLTRGTTVIQSKVIIPASKFSVGPNGVWYFCSGYLQLPSSPGPATLAGLVAFTANGGTKPVTTKIAYPVLLQ